MVAGTATNITVLILGKVLQGGGLAMTQSTSTAMIVSVFPSSERGKAMGSHVSVVGAGSVAGPALGGLLVSTLGWQWVFFINIPAGILAMAVALFVLDRGRLAQEGQEGQRPRFDWLGAALSAGALITFLMVVTSGPSSGWISAPMVTAMLAFAALLGTFIWWELRIPAPMLDLRLFKRWMFSQAVSVGFISFFGGSAVRFLMPFYLQKVLGFSPGKVGLILIPVAICIIVIGPMSGRLSDRYGWRKFKVGGLLLSAGGLFLLSRLTETSHWELAMAGMMLQASGMGMFNSPNYSSILGSVEQWRYGVVSALIHLVRNSANVTSIAVAIAIVTAVMASMGHPPSLEAVSDAGEGGAEILSAFTSGLRVAYLAMGSLLLLGVAVALLRDSQTREAPTRQVEEPEAEGSHPD